MRCSSKTSRGWQFAGLMLALCLTCMLSGCGEKVSEDGFRYTLSSGAATITGYEGEALEIAVPAELDGAPVTAVAAGVFPQGLLGVSLPACVETVWDGAFSAEAPPRYILLEGEGTSVDGAPEESTVLRVGQQLESGVLASVVLDASHVLYGVTETGGVELLAFPEEMLDVYEVPEQIDQGYPYTYISAAALEAGPAFSMLALGENTALAPEYLEQFREEEILLYPEDSLSADWILSVDAASQINQKRQEEGLSSIAPDVTLVRAARTRMEELSESYSFDRPDGSLWSSVLTEQKVPFQLAAALRGRYSSLEEGYESAVAATVDYYDTQDENGVLYDKLGVSVGSGLYEGESAYLFSGVVTNTTMTELVWGGLTYSIEADHAELSSVPEGITGATLSLSLYGKPITEIQAGAFQDAGSLRYVVLSSNISELDSSVFDGCSELRALVLPEGTAVRGDLPAQCAVIPLGMDTGDGLTTSAYVDGNGYVYLLTNLDRYVLYDIPDDVERIAVTRRMGDYPVTLLHANALQNKPNLEYVAFFWNCGIDPATLDILNQYTVLVADESGEAVSTGSLGTTLYGAAILSDALATQINEMRPEGAVGIRATYKAVRAAWLLAQEQSEQYAQTRPDGREWTTIFDDEAIADWGYARMYRDVLYGADEITIATDAFAEASAQEDDGGYYREMGMGLCPGTYEGRQAAFFYGLAFVGAD